MGLKPINKTWGNDNKNVNYVGKDFATLKQTLIDYTKTYFPNTYSDFNEASPGMVFVEQAAAIGDMERAAPTSECLGSRPCRRPRAAIER